MAELNKAKKVYVAGHTGLVGTALIKQLALNGFTQLITQNSEQLDLRIQHDVNHFFSEQKPAYVFLAAAKVGGIQANIDSPATFLYDNLMISANVIDAAYRFGVEKLLFFGSSCIYPINMPQPLDESMLLAGALEKTNEPYAVAKIAAIKLCQSYNKQYGTNFICCMPTNLYGPHDSFNAITSHVIPALIAKLYAAHQQELPHVTLWGTGTAQREFLYVDDMARAALFLMEQYASSEIINVGSGHEISIRELACLIKDAIGYQGMLLFNPEKPDGIARKLLNSSRIETLGWKASIDLKTGIKNTVDWYINQQKKCVAKQAVHHQKESSL